MSDLMVLAERYAAFTIRAERLQAAMDAIAKAEPDVEMCAMIDSLKVRRDKELTDRASIQLEMMKLLDEMKGDTPSRESLGSPRMMTSKTASRMTSPTKGIILKGEPKPIDGGMRMIPRKGSDPSDKMISPIMEDDRMCIYEICPMMTGDEWPDCKKCPYADGTEGDERMRCETEGCRNPAIPRWVNGHECAFCEGCWKTFMRGVELGTKIGGI